MATSAITNTLSDPSGTALADVVVVARLKPGNSFRTSDNSEVSTIKSTTTNGSGAWSLTLEENANIVPAGTYYEIEEQIPVSAGGAQVWRIQVGASDATLRASLLSTLPTDAISGNITQDTADARYVSVSGLQEAFVDVKRDFGAVGDGTTDDTAAIQAAIDSIPTTVPGGGIVFFPAGLYRIASPGLSRIGAALIFRGATAAAFNESDSQGRGSMLIVDAGVTLLTIGTTPAGVDHAGPVFENLHFREAAAAKTSTLVRINNTNRWTFRNCGFRGAAAAIFPYADSGSGAGVGGADASWGFIENCWVSLCTVGLDNSTGVDVTVVGGDWECTTAIRSYPAGSLTGTLLVTGAWFDGGVGIDTKGFGGSFVGCCFEGCNPAINITRDAGLHASSGLGNKIIGAHISGTGAGDVGINIGTGATGTQILGLSVSNVTSGIVDAGGTSTVYESGATDLAVYNRPTSASNGYVLFKNAGTNLVRMSTDGSSSWVLGHLVSGGKTRLRLGGTSSSDELTVQDSASTALFRVLGDSQIVFGGTGLAFMSDGKHLSLGTTTGTKIGTATTQKLGFFNATPVVQPAANADTSGATLGQLETEVNELKATLRSLGLLAT